MIKFFKEIIRYPIEFIGSLLALRKEISGLSRSRKNFLKNEKIWLEKTEGMTFVRVDSNSDLIMFHLTLDYTPTLKEWLKENCEEKYMLGHFQYTGSGIFFNSKSDAVRFKLQWI